MIELTTNLFEEPFPLPQRDGVVSLTSDKPLFTLRPYQQEAVDRGIGFLKTPSKRHAFQILPTGSGKSLVIANIAKGMDGKVLVLQPSKEILEQNHRKLLSYGYMAGIYSASAGQKFIGKITFATIGSIINKMHLFREFKYLLIDECHLVNAKADDSMYNKFISGIEDIRVLGFTATPYRLSPMRDERGHNGAMLKFLNRTKPKIFSFVNYVVQNHDLFEAGFLAKLEYWDKSVIDRTKLTMNSSGTDFTDNSLKSYYRKINMPGITIDYANRLLAKRKNLLVFCSLIEEANEVAKGVPGAVVLTGETDMNTRASILTRFKSGSLRCVINVGVLTTGFDYPELECILLARSTMSLALYYQIIGRAMRPHPDKQSAWIVDLGGNIRFFGRIEDLEVRMSDKKLYSIWNGRKNKQLTNVMFTKA